MVIRGYTCAARFAHSQNARAVHTVLVKHGYDVDLVLGVQSDSSKPHMITMHHEWLADILEDDLPAAYVDQLFTKYATKEERDALEALWRLHGRLGLASIWFNLGADWALQRKETR